MIEQESLKRCTCDFCGAKEYITKSEERPFGWSYVGLHMARFDACKQCYNKVKSAVNALMYKYKVEDTNGN